MWVDRTKDYLCVCTVEIFFLVEKKTVSVREYAQDNAPVSIDSVKFLYIYYISLAQSVPPGTTASQLQELKIRDWLM